VSGTNLIRVLRGTDGRTVWPELLLNDSLPITSVRNILPDLPEQAPVSIVLLVQVSLLKH
jgi:hypothetical protein